VSYRITVSASVLLTVVIVSSLHAYTCVLDPAIHRYVDMGKNCEDIAMNMMVSGLTGHPPVCIAEEEVLDFGTSKGISISTSFTARRDHCTADLIELFTRDTLISTREYVREFRGNTFRKTPWEELDDVLVSCVLDCSSSPCSPFPETRSCRGTNVVAILSLLRRLLVPPRI
jgi:hypothetical protein